MEKLIEALEASLSFSRECGLTDEQANLIANHIEALRGLDRSEAESAMIQAHGSIDNHSYRNYSPQELDKVLNTLSHIRRIFEE